MKRIGKKTQIQRFNTKFSYIKCGGTGHKALECEIKHRNVNAFSYFSTRIPVSGAKIHSNSNNEHSTAQQNQEQWSEHTHIQLTNVLMEFEMRH